MSAKWLLLFLMGYNVNCSLFLKPGYGYTLIATPHQQKYATSEILNTTDILMNST